MRIVSSLLFGLLSLISFSVSAQIWSKKADLPGATRLAPTAFSMNGDGYVCCGKQSILSNSLYYRDFWKYEEQSNSWTRLPDFPGIPRSGAIAFVFDTVVYAGLGWDGSNDLKDVFKYNLDSNRWDSVGIYPGAGGRIGFGAYLNGKGYYGGGTDGSSRQSDFWEFDPTTNTWLSKGSFPFGRRSNGISIGGDSLIYMGLGFDNSLSMKKDFWSYNPQTSVWTRLADFPGVARVGATVFVFNGVMIVGGGQRTGGIELGDYYAYDVQNNAWNKISSPSFGAFRSFSSAFSIGTSAYLFGGNNSNNQSLKDLLSYKLDTTVSICDSLVWLRRKSFPDSNRALTSGFALQGKGYVCCGKDAFSGSGVNFFKDTWEFDPGENTWTRVADFPGVARSAAVTFVIDSFAYVGLGWDGSNALKDMYRYSPHLNRWDSIANYPGSGGRQGFGTSVNGKGYVAAGTDGINWHDDFWEYNPANDTWTRINNFPVGKRSNGPSISMDSLLFMGLGINGTNRKKDFWSYNPALNKWTQLADLPGPARIGAVAIKHNKKIIIGGGHKAGGIELGDYYELNPVTKVWRRVEPMEDSIRTFASSFSLDGSGYVFGGRDQNNNVLVDLWELSDFGFDTTISFSACDSFTFDFNNQTYYSSGIFYADTLRSVGCDTVIRLELTITKSTSFSIRDTACDSYVWPQNGKTYLNSGTYYDTLINAVGCDSVVSLNLMVNKPVRMNYTVMACKEYQWNVNSTLYTQGGTYLDTVFNGNSCDTIHTLNLTLTSIDTGISIVRDTLFSGQTNAAYQWLDCNNGNLPIPGATTSFFVASVNGNYACEITRNFCVDTSACYNMTVTSITDEYLNSSIRVSPNPFNNFIDVTIEKYQGRNKMLVYDLTGKIIQEHYFQFVHQIDMSMHPSGFYYMAIYDEANKLIYSNKLVKQ